MLSSELAELAGVTVRTLRHHHQIGLLPEPPRSVGGYRHYAVGDLVRLLRITRMTALGVPLSVLAALLDDPSAAEGLFDELDRQAAAEIERLTARRATIGALRRSGAPPDLPPELSALRSDPSAEIPVDMGHLEHEQLVLLGHLLDEDGAARLAAAYGEADSSVAALAPLTTRFYALEHDSPDEEVASLIDALVANLGPLATRLATLSPLDALASALMEELNEQALTPVQRRVVHQVQQRLDRPDEA